MPAGKKKSGINLLVTPERQEDLSAQFLTWALTYGRYIIIIIQIVVLSVFFMRFKLDRDRTDLKERVQQKQALIQSIFEVENEIKRVQKRLSDIKLISTNQDIYLTVISFLENNSPSDLTFSVISFDKQKIKMVASADNLKSFNFFLKQIQDSEMFKDIQLEDLKRRADGKVEFRVQTILTGQMYDK